MDLNREKSGMEKRFLELCQKVVFDNQLEVYDLEYIQGSTTMRLFIVDPKTNSAVIEDCVLIDRALTEPIEEAQWIPDSFVLEVSSPGVYRKLSTKKHLMSAKGERVQVSFTGEPQGENLPKGMMKSNKLSAQLVDFDDKKISLELDGLEFYIEIENIKSMNLDPIL